MQYKKDFKINYKTFKKLETLLISHIEDAKRKATAETKDVDTSNIDINPELIKIGKELQIQQQENIATAKNIIMSIAYQCTVEELEELDYNEVMAMWQRIVDDKHTIVDFLMLA